MSLQSVHEHNTGIPLDARETFRGAPAWCQPILTCISGRPLAGSAPLFTLRPFAAIAIDLVKYGVGVVTAALFWQAGGAWYAAMILSWILTVNATRSLTSDAHYAGHGSVTGHKRLDKIIGDLLSLIALAPNMDDYALPHNRGHHGRIGIGSSADPDIGLIRVMGIEMGRSLGYYRLRHALVLISPRYYAVYTLLRLKSTFITAPYWRMIVAFFLWGGVAITAYLTGLVTETLVALVVPLVWLYAVSAALQFPSEHKWLAPQGEDETRGAYLLRVSHGRFFLVPAPDTKLGWPLWAFKMLPMLFGRFFVCVSILPAHDYHHRNAGCKTWPMEPWLRQSEIDRGARYTDYYGLRAPTHAQFEIWTQTPNASMPQPFSFLSLILTHLSPKKIEGCSDVDVPT
ncbi:MAG: fatty acid desaturase [Paracoccaceae bacterium]